MALAKPVFDSIIKLDKRLEALQNEVSDLEKQYGFSEDFAMESRASKKTDVSARKRASAHTTVPTKQKRYKDLPTIKVQKEEVPQKVIKPEIAPDWQEAHKINPSLYAFYDKNYYQPKHFDDRDFNIKPTFTNDFGYFNECMSSFAVDYDRLPEKYTFV